jgi:hypothetical protein
MQDFSVDVPDHKKDVQCLEPDGSNAEEVVHVAVTPCPTAEWTAQQIIECCAWDRWPPRFLIHDRDSRYGAIFEAPWH